MKRFDYRCAVNEVSLYVEKENKYARQISKEEDGSEARRVFLPLS